MIDIENITVSFINLAGSKISELNYNTSKIDNTLSIPMNKTGINTAGNYIISIYGVSPIFQKRIIVK